MAQNPDPFDVEALERSLNDSATRVSTIWISFLLFGLYLVVAADTVTHRQLLLEDPIKLPVLSVDLPLVGFFFLTPILFVVFHTYVLLQVLLLGRTAATYNRALDRTVKVSTDNAAMRQRLANTLFAQIFAGSPREREGWLGSLLRMMAWLTLAIAPVLVLLVFQFKFLPYHSHLITWALRLLILLDLIGVLVLWRAAHQSDRDLTWRLVFQGWIGWPSAFALAVISWIVLTFPGEPHAQWTRYLPKEEFKGLRECETESAISVAFPLFDRLNLSGVDFVDTDKLTRIQKEKREERKKKTPVEHNKYTHSFRSRDMNCAELSLTDLRSVDLRNTGLRGADLFFANLEGADLSSADLRGVRGYGTALDDADLNHADLRGASFPDATLQRADFSSARLQGADLRRAQLHGAEFTNVRAQGADLSSARLEGALFWRAQLQGADLSSAYLQFAILWDAQLQGADLSGADLSAAHLQQVGLQGADLNESRMQYTVLTAPRVWRAKNATCTNARVDSQLSDALLPELNDDDLALPIVRRTVPGTRDNIEKFIEESVAGISDLKRKQTAKHRMRSGLDPGKDDTAAIGEVWRECGVISQVSRADFGKRSDAFLRALFCDTEKRVCGRDFYCDVRAVNRSVSAIVRAMAISHSLSAPLVGGMLGLEREPCAASAVLDEENKARLRDVLAAPNQQ